MSYKAIITKVKNIRPMLGADRLRLATVANNQIIIGTDIEEGTLGVFFPDDGALSHEFCHENNLYRHKEYNKNPEAKGGFFEDNRRVKVLKLRGEKSEGFWCPLEYLSYTGYNLDKLNEGFEFDKLNGFNICEKYYTPATRKMMKAAGKGNRVKNKSKKLKLKEMYPDFKEHWDTKQLAYYIDKLPKGILLQISEKVHGTSGRIGYIKLHKYLNKFQKLWNKYLPIKFQEYEYKYISGSRRVILHNNKEDGYYKDSDFRSEIHKKIEKIGLNPGETIYFEICGFTDQGKNIMSPQGIKDKELKKLYGDTMVYSYGCDPNEKLNKPKYDIYVYRITRTLDNGSISEVPYYQLVGRCKELDLKIVPELKEQFIFDGDTKKLLKTCEELAEGPSTIDKSHIREGIVLRCDYPGMETNFKLKSFHFKTLEGLIKNDPKYIDMEEIS